MSSPSNQIDAKLSDTESTALELVAKSYDHHKSHARFEETQRSWFLAAYLTFTGLVISGILSNFFKDGKYSAGFENLILLLLLTNLAIGVCVAFAVMKVSAEFKRHNDRAEAILEYFRKHTDNQNLKNLLSLAKLHTATHDIGHNSITAFFSVAAMHNYILSAFIALDIVLVARVQFESLPTIILISIWCVAFLTASWLQHQYLRYVEKQHTPIPRMNTVAHRQDQSVA